nr:hypothetical protein Iba_chr02eCG8510 [Ipomoea batatas]
MPIGVFAEINEDIDHVFDGTTEEGGWGPLVAEPRQIMLLKESMELSTMLLDVPGARPLSLCYGDSDAYKNLSFDNLAFSWD